MSQTKRVAKLLLLDGDGDFLLLQRSDSHPHLAGFYDLPGGLIEATEEPGEAVARELQEETGIELLQNVLSILYTTTHMIHGKSYPTLLYAACIEDVRPEVRISWEHKAYEWAPLEHLPKVEPQLAPTYREALHYIRENNIIEDLDIAVTKVKVPATS